MFSGPPAVLAVLYFKEEVSSPFNKLWEFLPVQILVIFWNEDCLSMVHINEFKSHCQFLFSDGNLFFC